MAHRRRLQHVVDRDLVLEVRVRIARAVVVVLHGDRCEHLACRAVLVHVTSRERREQHRRGLAACEDRVAGRRARAALPRSTCRASSRRRSRARRRARRWQPPSHRRGRHRNRMGTRSRCVCTECPSARSRSGSCCRRCLPAPTVCRAASRRTPPRPGSARSPCRRGRSPRRTRRPPSARSSGRTAHPS